MSAGQVNIRKIEGELSNASEAKSSDRETSVATDSNKSGRSIVRGVRHVIPMSTAKKIQTGNELKLREEPDTDVSNSHPSSPLELKHGPVSEGRQF